MNWLGVALVVPVGIVASLLAYWLIPASVLDWLAEFVIVTVFVGVIF